MSSPTATENRQNPPGMMRRVVLASGLGTFVEYFDYACYSYFATTIAVVFFPSDDPTVGLLSTFAVFAVSFFIRPIGAIAWGYLGDRVGRKSILAMTILIMSGSTFAIAFIPGHATIGIAAPILLLVFRLTQSFSASGEYAGAGTFIAEYAPPRRRGLLTSMVPLSAAAGFLLASIVATVSYGAMSSEFMETWGWRIPFLIAGPLGIVGLWLRTRLEDSPQFRRAAEKEEELKKLTEQERAAGSTSRRQEIMQSLPSMVKLLLVFALNAGGYYLLLSYVPTYLIEQTTMDESSSNLVVTIGLVAHLALIPLTAIYSDRIGHRRIMLVSSIAFIILSYPLMMLLSMGGLLLATTVLITFLVFFAMNDAVFPSFFTEMFGTRSRYLGFAVPFNIGAMLFGGVAPYTGTWLIEATGDPNSPAFFLIAVAVLSTIGLLLSPETARTQLSEDQRDVGTGPIATV